MSLGSAFAVVLVVCGSAMGILSAADTMDHPQMGRDDKFALCAREVFHKTVLRSTEVPWLAEQLRCPQAAPELTEALRGLGYELHEGPDWLFIMSAHVPGVEYHEWRSLKMHFTVENRRSPGARAVDASEAQRIARTVFAAARPIPFSPGLAPSQGNDVLEEDMPAVIDAIRLGRPAESVITIFNQGSHARLTYGEIRDNKYVPLWDTPHTNGFDLGWSYRDIDGDGVKEILLWSLWLPHTHVLSIFDLNGRELTRRSQQCEEPFRAGGVDPAGDACPIYGDEIDVQPPTKGKPGDIVVAGQIQGADGEGPHTYRFTNGRYRLVPQRRLKP